MDSLLETVAAGMRNVGRLSDPSHLQEAAERIVDLALNRGSTYLLPASPAAQRLVTAALLLSPELRAATVTPAAEADISGEAVLVVDVNLASGTTLAQAAQRARFSGATSVDGAVLHALMTVVGPHECGLDRLEILEAEQRNSHEKA